MSDPCEVCNEMTLKIGHKCLSHSNCIIKNQYYPSKCKICHNNILNTGKGDKIGSRQTIKRNAAIKFINKIMEAFGTTLNPGDCIMPIGESATYGQEWLKEYIYVSPAPEADMAADEPQCQKMSFCRIMRKN